MALEIIFYENGAVGFEDGNESFGLTAAETDELIAGLAKQGRINLVGFHIEPACQECGQTLGTDLETGRTACPNCGVMNKNG